MKLIRVRVQHIGGDGHLSVRRTTLHALREQGENGRVIALCGRRWYIGDWAELIESEGEKPTCNQCATSLKPKVTYERRVQPSVRQVEAAAAEIQAGMQVRITRQKLMLADISKLHVATGAGYCRECKEKWPCPTIKILHEGKFDA